MKEEIFYNHIYILDSLLPEDEKTGSELFTQLKYLHFGNAFFHVTRYEIKNVRDLLLALSYIDLSISTSNLPLLHFEMHGIKEGILLSDGTIIRWKNLVKVLRKINVKTQNNLYIVFNTCFAAYIQKYIDIKLPAPFYGFIAPLNEVNANQLNQDFIKFYKYLISYKSFDKAIESLHETTNPIIYNYSNCYGYFDLLIKTKVNQPDIIESQFKSIYKKCISVSEGEIKKLIKGELEVAVDNMKKNYCYAQFRIQ